MAEDRRFPLSREAVASFASRADFERAVANLKAAGFEASDISVLGSHDSLATAGEKDEQQGAAGLAAEIKYLGPLTIAGIIMVSGGPVAATLAAVVSAGLGGAAIKELLDGYFAPRHKDEFVAALEAGALLLWVRVDDPEMEQVVLRILAESGGRNAHMHARRIEAAPD
jgi:hypothetical protein